MKSKKSTYKQEIKSLSDIDLNDHIKVSEAIRIQQDLISAKNDLDDELRRLRLIHKYSQDTLTVKTKQEFGELTIEYFIEIFNAARGLVCEYGYAGTEMEHLGVFGFSNIETPEGCEGLIEILKALPKKCDFLSNHTELNNQLGFLNLKEAYICPLYFDNVTLSGLIIIGNTEDDALFYPQLSSDRFSTFYTLSQTVGLHLKNLNSQKSLKQELTETKYLKDELTANSVILTGVNHDLELEVSDRTKMLEEANVLLKREIEERGLIEKKLRKQAHELKRSNEDLTQFASVISHDLKSPLRGVMGFTELFYQKYIDVIDAKGTEYLDFIMGGVKHFSEIIDDLLEFSKVSNIDASKRKINFDKLIQKVLFSLQKSIESKQAIVAVEPLPQIVGDPFQLESLFQNLIENGLKFSDKERRPVIKIKCNQIDGNHVFSVNDNGIGIDDKYEDKIFKLFERLHTQSEYEGTGLGLTISKKIVERHDGEIWFESEIGKGTTFFFSIPIQN